MEFFTLNWVEDSAFDDDLDDMFAVEYESFLIDDELEYDVVEFDDLCSTTDYLLATAFEYASKYISPPLALELKSLPNSFQCSFLGLDELLPVIIASDLYQDKENKLIVQLRENKEVTGWTLGDIKCISPSIVQHGIHLEDNAKPYRGRQRCLNSTFQEVVRKEVLKWLDYESIYPIFDSEWVSLVQVIPKKIDTTSSRNNKNELVASRVQFGWCVCTGY